MHNLLDGCFFYHRDIVCRGKGDKQEMKNRNGFALIELLIVIAIVGVLIAIAIPRFKNIIHQNTQGVSVGLAVSNNSSSFNLIKVAEGVVLVKAINTFGDNSGDLNQGIEAVSRKFEIKNMCPLTRDGYTVGIYIVVGPLK